MTDAPSRKQDLADLARRVAVATAGLADDVDAAPELQARRKHARFIAGQAALLADNLAKDAATPRPTLANPNPSPVQVTNYEGRR